MPNYCAVEHARGGERSGNISMYRKDWRSKLVRCKASTEARARARFIDAGFYL